MEQATRDYRKTVLTPQTAFRVVRNGSAIGQHVLTFAEEQSRLTVRIMVDIAVGFGPITFYRYQHRATERWENGRVVTFEAETNDDGAVSTIAMRRDGDALAVESSQAGSYRAPANALPATHWNRRKAAQHLGVSYKTLLNKMKECGIAEVKA